MYGNGGPRRGNSYGGPSQGGGNGGGSVLSYLVIFALIFFGWSWYKEKYVPNQTNQAKQELASLKSKSDSSSSSSLIGVDPNKSYQDGASKSESSNSNGTDQKLSDQNLLSYTFNIDKYPENYLVVDNSQFTQNEINQAQAKQGGNAWYEFSPLDDLGRSRDAKAFVTSKSVKDTAKMKRPPIPGGKNLPTGYVGNNKKVQLPNYRGYFYNKSHQIAWSFVGSIGGGDNANNEIMDRANLVTGTRAQNVGNNGRNNQGAGGMSYTETIVRNYLKNKENGQVLYTVHPVYKDNELVPRGSLVRVKSIDNGGLTIDSSVWVFNTQDGAKIDYKTGQFTLDK